MVSHTLAARTVLAAPLLAIVADGGPRSGFGHVGRCLAIWEQLEGRAAFAVRNRLIARRLAALGVPLVAPDTLTRLVLLDRRRPTGATVVTRMQARGARVCLLDDLGAGRTCADLLVDPPTGSSWPSTHVPRLMGFEHVLLRREVRIAAQRPNPEIRVLISMGASDPEGLTPALARALRAAGLSVHSALGPLYRGARPDGAVLADPEAWPRALAGADLLVSRFGHTLLEAAHLGPPALAVARGWPAARDAAAFAAHGTAEAVPLAGPADAARVAERACALLGDPARLATMAKRGRTLVDGLGAKRVATALRELA